MVTTGRADGRFAVVHRLRLIDVGEHLFRRLFGLVLELDAEVCRDVGGGIVVDRIVDGLCDALFEEALGDLDRSDAELFAEHLQRDIFGSDDGVIDLDRLHRLLLLLFDAQLAVAALVFVEVGDGYLLLGERALADRALLLGIGLIVRLLFGRSRKRLCGRDGHGGGSRTESCPGGTGTRRGAHGGTCGNGRLGSVPSLLHLARLRARRKLRARAALCGAARRCGCGPLRAVLRRPGGVGIDVGAAVRLPCAAVGVLRADDLLFHAAAHLRAHLRAALGRLNTGGRALFGGGLFCRGGLRLDGLFSRLRGGSCLCALLRGKLFRLHFYLFGGLFFRLCRALFCGCGRGGLFLHPLLGGLLSFDGRLCGLFCRCGRLFFGRSLDMLRRGPLGCGRSLNGGLRFGAGSLFLRAGARGGFEVGEFAQDIAYLLFRTLHLAQQRPDPFRPQKRSDRFDVRVILLCFSHVAKCCLPNIF